MKNKIINYLLIVIAITVTNCSNNDFNLSNPSAISVVQFYKTPADAEQAVIAIYDTFSQLQFDQSGNGLDQLSEDVYANGTAFDQFSMTPQDAWVEYMWQYSFIAIYRSNIAIAKIPEITFTDAAQKARLIAEAKFMRAWHYFYLVQYYGRVPIITTPVDVTNEEERSPKRAASVTDVWTQIEKDLTEAIPDLPTMYNDANVGRATKGAAMGYLGKAYIYQGKWAKAKSEFEGLMALTNVNQVGISQYGLLENFGDNFHGKPYEWSKEAIFQLDYSNSFALSNMWGGGPNNAKAKYLGWGSAYPNKYAVHVFEPMDTVRLFASICGASTVINGITYANVKTIKEPKHSNWSLLTESDLSMGKYINQDTITDVFSKWNGTGLTEDYNVNLMRYSDVLLMYAEAVNELSGPTPEAVGAFNQIRRRAKVPEYPNYAYSSSYVTVAGTNTKDDFRNAIKHERQVEFFFEQLHFLDLVRWGDCAVAYSKANDYERLVNTTTSNQNFGIGKNELLPIPNSEMNLNPSMMGDQNPGW
jgi:hypothetical protein